MIDVGQRRIINKFLGTKGLATLDDIPGLLTQLAAGIRNHDQFRSFLLKCEPEKRRDAYNCMGPKMSFKVKPLEDYLREGADYAERHQLPAYDHETQSFKDYEPPSVGTKEHATEVIREHLAFDANKRRLTITCAKCTFAEEFTGKTLVDAVGKARKSGWVYQAAFDDQPEKELCRKCYIPRRKAN